MALAKKAGFLTSAALATAFGFGAAQAQDKIDCGELGKAAHSMVDNGSKIIDIQKKRFAEKDLASETYLAEVDAQLQNLFFMAVTIGAFRDKCNLEDVAPKILDYAERLETERNKALGAALKQ